MLFAAIIAIAALVIVGASFVVLRRGRHEGLTIDPPDLTAVVDIGEVATDVEAPGVAEEATPVEDAPRPSFRERLAGARSSLTGFFGGIFSGTIDRDTWETLEEALIRADVGVGTSTEIMEAVKVRVETDGVEHQQGHQHPQAHPHHPVTNPGHGGANAVIQQQYHTEIEVFRSLRSKADANR